MATRPVATAGTVRPGVGIAGALIAFAVAAAIIGVVPRLADSTIHAVGVTGPAAAEALFTLLVFGALALAGLAGGAMTGVAAWAMGPRPGVMLAAGGATGLATFLLALAYAALAGTLVNGAAAPAPVGFLLAGLLVVLAQVVAEEIYFRGWVQPMLARGIGQLPAVLVTGTAFGLLHALGSATNAIALLNMVAGGVMFGLLAARCGGVAAAIGAHGAWNVTEQLVVGLDPNPGIGSFGALIDWDLSGAVAWGGSSDGLNGSVAMLFAQLSALAVLLLLQWPQPSETAERARGATNATTRRIGT